jgi:hypothetical protein
MASNSDWMALFTFGTVCISWSTLPFKSPDKKSQGFKIGEICDHEHTSSFSTGYWFDRNLSPWEQHKISKVQHCWCEEWHHLV